MDSLESMLRLGADLRGKSTINLQLSRQLLKKINNYYLKQLLFYLNY